MRIWRGVVAVTGATGGGAGLFALTTAVSCCTWAWAVEFATLVWTKTSGRGWRGRVREDLCRLWGCHLLANIEKARPRSEDGGSNHTVEAWLGSFETDYLESDAGSHLPLHADPLPTNCGSPLDRGTSLFTRSIHKIDTLLAYSPTPAHPSHSHPPHPARASSTTPLPFIALTFSHGCPSRAPATNPECTPSSAHSAKDPSAARRKRDASKPTAPCSRTRFRRGTVTKGLTSPLYTTRMHIWTLGVGVRRRSSSEARWEWQC